MTNRPGTYQKVRSVLLKTISEIYPANIDNYANAAFIAKIFILNSAVYFSAETAISKLADSERPVDLNSYFDKIMSRNEIGSETVEFNQEGFLDFILYNAANSNLYSKIEKKCLLPLHTHYYAYIIPGLVYEQLLRFNDIRREEDKLQSDQSFRKKNGAYYTPPILAKSIVANAWNAFHKQQQSDEWQHPVVLDLACGPGIFTHLIIDLFIHKAKEKDYSNELLYSEIVLKNIYGIDTDVSAIELLKTTIAFRILNYMDKHTYKEILTILNEKFQVKDILFIETHTKTYDIILSNPPYVSLYSRQSAKTTVDSKTARKISDENSDDSMQKRLNLSMYILGFGFKYTKDKGIFAFIHDINFFEKPFYNIRLQSIQTFHPLEIEINIAGFSGVNSGQTVVVMQKKSVVDNIQVHVQDVQDQSAYSISVEQFTKGAVFIDKTRYSQMQKLESYPKMGDYVEIRTGVNIGGSYEKFIHETKVSSDYYPFVVSGSITGRFEPLAATTLFIHFDTAFQNELNNAARLSGISNQIVLGDLHRFTGEKIFIRQSDSRLCATFVPQVVVAPYSMFVIYKSDIYPLKFILALLNSTFLTNYARYTGIIRISRGKQPQIRKSGLFNLPVPGYVKPESMQEIVDLVDSILVQFEAKHLDAIVELERNLDIKIDSLYEISADDVS
ncbi:MAG: class I SAM-dependent methyltransferase [Leptospirales bacterium]